MKNLKNMQWFNEPDVWSVENDVLEMQVTAQTDFWRQTHYGFTVDDGPFYYTVVGGEFEVKVKVTAGYIARFDQAGLMLRIDHENYVKFGIEYVDGIQNISAVVTHKTSDWSVIPQEKPLPFIWLKAVRRLDAVQLFFSFDDKIYTMMRTLYMPDNCPMQVGPVGASPDGNGFKAVFENFELTHLPDMRRLEWLNKK